MVVSLLRQLSESVDAGVAVASATVVDTSRSVPRRAGAKMLVFRDGSISGTVGGGEMEARVVSEAVAALGDGRCRLLSYRLVDPGRGDPGVCGGDVQILVEPHMPKPTVIVMGYGHVGRAVAQLAHWLGFRVVASDDRAGIEDGPTGGEDPEGLTDESPSGSVDELVIGSVADLLAGRTLDADASVVLVTRNVDVDAAALPALLATGAGYVGVMGSERRWATTRARLEADGVDPAALDRVHAPIGIEVGAETPEEIALSIMAEVIAHRRT
ncbi:MAG: XdhC family protein [Acidimicrobiaceae bacterium]|nr:XdhC family protein [Acidimicrobiaceae bacterium]